jgi:hypothetical protein
MFGPGRMPTRRLHQDGRQQMHAIVGEAKPQRPQRRLMRQDDAPNLPGAGSRRYASSSSNSAMRRGLIARPDMVGYQVYVIRS